MCAPSKEAVFEAVVGFYVPCHRHGSGGVDLDVLIRCDLHKISSAFKFRHKNSVHGLWYTLSM